MSFMAFTVPKVVTEQHFDYEIYSMAILRSKQRKVQCILPLAVQWWVNGQF